MNLLVIRHLKTQDNLEQRFSSGDRDVSILPNQKIPNNAVRELMALEPDGLIIAHTGLKRSVQTARLLGQSIRHKGKALIMPQFRERIGGSLAGLSFSELQKIFPELESPNQFWNIEAPNQRLESFPEFLSRIKKGIDRLVSIPAPNIILITHAGSIKGIKAVLTAEEADKQQKILCEETPQRELFRFHIERRYLPWQRKKN